MFDATRPLARLSVYVLPKVFWVFGFYLADLPSQPGFDCALHLPFAALHFQLLNGVPGFIQGDEMTRNGLGAVFRLNKFQQMAFGARVGAIWIPIIQTTQGVLED